MLKKYMLIWLTIICSVVFIFKLASLQLSSDSYFNSDFAIQEISIYPERGLIFDRNGQLLVANQPMYDLIIIPENTVEFDTLQLSKLIGIEKSELKKKIFDKDEIAPEYQLIKEISDFYKERIRIEVERFKAENKIKTTNQIIIYHKGDKALLEKTLEKGPLLRKEMSNLLELNKKNTDLKYKLDAAEGDIDKQTILKDFEATILRVTQELSQLNISLGGLKRNKEETSKKKSSCDSELIVLRDKYERSLPTQKTLDKTNQYIKFFDHFIKSLLKSWMSGSIPNDGIILRHAFNKEVDTQDYGAIKLFSKETNTIYQPKIKIGCKTNWTSGLVPMKWDTSLNKSGLKTDKILMAKCCKIKNIRKKADSAMATFLPTDDLKNPLI